MPFFDTSKLRGRIKEICGTMQIFADKMGFASNTLSQKLNGQSEFTQSEIKKAVTILNLTVDDIPLYFFTAKV